MWIDRQAFRRPITNTFLFTQVLITYCWVLSLFLKFTCDKLFEWKTVKMRVLIPANAVYSDHKNMTLHLFRFFREAHISSDFLLRNSHLFRFCWEAHKIDHTEKRKNKIKPTTDSYFACRFYSKEKSDCKP